MINFSLKHLQFIEEKLSQVINDKGVNNVFNNLNNYINLKILDEYIENLIKDNQYKSSKAKNSAMEPIRGRICEEIFAIGVERYLKENKLDDKIFIDSKNDLIEKYFSVYTANNINLRKKIDVDICLSNNDKTKFYALSVKGTTRERVGQSETALFLLDKDAMQAKYNTTSDCFKCDLWDTNGKEIKIKYGMVVYDFGEDKDYTIKTKSGRQRKKQSTREFDVELFYQDKKIGGGFTLLNNYENFTNTIKFSALCGLIQGFFN